MKERWIDDIKAEMQEFESDSPKGLWESIEGRLPASKVAPTRSWWGWAAAAGALAVAGVSAFLFFRPISPQEVISVERAESVVALNDVLPDPSEQIVRLQEAVAPVAVSQPKEAQRPEKSAASQKTEALSETAAVQETETVQEPESLPWEEFSQEPRVARKTPQNKVSVGLAASGAASFSQTALIGGGPLFGVGLDAVSWEDSPKLGLAVVNQGKDIESELRHKVPVRLTLGVSYAITDRLSVVSGLSHTLLLSEYKEGTQQNYKSGEQRVEYVGVPINLKYDFYSSTRLDVYASAGLTLDKCIKANRTDDYFLSGENRLKEVISLGEHPFQLSAGAAFGAEYRIYDSLWLFGECGLAYFFNDRSSLEILYKERPLNATFNLGIRVAL
ncbi:MAG: outer membrane beta-barrel protein [Bacteroidales bacterium]|nr:outer membrane beta-barrel protein [Bacteroidales bacterium]